MTFDTVSRIARFVEAACLLGVAFFLIRPLYLDWKWKRWARVPKPDRSAMILKAPGAAPNPLPDIPEDVQ